MSNLILNIRFLIWYLQITNEGVASFSKNDNWREFKWRILKKPFQVHYINFRKLKGMYLNQNKEGME